MGLNKKVLIIVYRFPPMGGVGSRRWAKFSKYLARDGWDVHIITTNYSWIDPINWSSDVQDVPGITVIRLPSGYPNFFFRPYQSKFARALVRVCRVVYDAVTRRHSDLDYASAWTRNLVSYAVNYIRTHQISNVVVSGPPSSLHVSGALIKCEVPFVHLIQDYRDPWSNVHDYAMRKIGSPSKKLNILCAESMALQAADKVVVVSQQMADDLSRTFALPKEKLKVIYNGFDASDFAKHSSMTRKVAGTQVKIGYFGTVGRTHGRMKALEMIAAVLKQMNEEGARFEFHLYSDLPINYFSNSENAILRDRFKCFSMVSKERMMEIIGELDVCLAINAPEDGYAIASKVYEYMGAAKPIFLISPDGEASQLLADAGQYTADYSALKIQIALTKILMDKDNCGAHVQEANAMYARFDLRELSKEYSELFIQ